MVDHATARMTEGFRGWVGHAEKTNAKNTRTVTRFNFWQTVSVNFDGKRHWQEGGR
jgi:hypothetical protein